MAMKQPKTDYGTKGESGEKVPNAGKPDLSGERKGRMKNGVAMGSADDTGGRAAGSKDLGEFNGGRKDSVIYTHQRIPHDQDK